MASAIYMVMRMYARRFLFMNFLDGTTNIPLPTPTPDPDRTARLLGRWEDERGIPHTPLPTVLLTSRGRRRRRRRRERRSRREAVTKRASCLDINSSFKRSFRVPNVAFSFSLGRSSHTKGVGRPIGFFGGLVGFCLPWLWRFGGNMLPLLLFIYYTEAIPI
ncbi:hypothetical protein B0T22DRAFT_107337 [Podospora appendiculata]|uniref:Uncharacterized protein n=1 Tax=Podospora appendiculata TaxID=314037 RepID=A0AAE1CI29_9PEZI|nr:hypothetical protein B0T22DRAFT_107337 [Podospora appendiculata]